MSTTPCGPSGSALWPAEPRVRILTVAGTQPASRGAELAAGLTPWLPTALAVYDRLFAVAGLSPGAVRGLGLAARDALHDWAPELGAELDACALASGLPPERLHALNARTELLAAAGATGLGECSTVAGTDAAGTDAAGTTIGAQTWDWHQELAGSWAVLSYPDGRYPFVTLTEAGLLAKIGLNAVGVGLLFNILSHHSDTGVGGVPVHAVARRILDSATDVEGAIEILRSAPLAASSCFTLLDPSRVACLEASPAGVAELAPAGWTVHTNHFLDPALATGGQPLGPDSDTLQRQGLLAERAATGRGLLAAARTPADVDGVHRLAELLCAHEADGAAVCCHARATATFGSRWQTLATVAVQPAARRLSVLAGGPCGQSRQGWRAFEPGR